MNIKELAKSAQKEGICTPGMKRILQSSDKESLLNYFIEGIDFCLEHNFPSCEFLKQEGGDLLQKRGIVVDEKFSHINRSVSVVLGKSKGEISVTDYGVSDIFVKHISSVTVYASSHSFVRIDCFDESEVKVHASGNAKVIVNVYGNAKVTYQKADKAQVKVVVKGKESY